MSVLDLFRLKRADQPEEESDGLDDELDLPAFERRSGEWKSGVRALPDRPLEWTTAPPTRPGLYWVRFPGGREFEVIRVESGVEFGLGLEWSSAPLPVPYEVKTVRR